MDWKLWVAIALFALGSIYVLPPLAAAMLYVLTIKFFRWYLGSDFEEERLAILNDDDERF